MFDAAAGRCAAPDTEPFPFAMGCVCGPDLVAVWRHDPTSQRTHRLIMTSSALEEQKVNAGGTSPRTAALLRDTMLLKVCVGSRLLLQRADAYQGPEMRALLSVKA